VGQACRVETLDPILSWSPGRRARRVEYSTWAGMIVTQYGRLPGGDAGGALSGGPARQSPALDQLQRYYGTGDSASEPGDFKPGNPTLTLTSAGARLPSARSPRSQDGERRVRHEQGGGAARPLRRARLLVLHAAALVRVRVPCAAPYAAPRPGRAAGQRSPCASVHGAAARGAAARGIASHQGGGRPRRPSGRALEPAAAPGPGGREPVVVDRDRDDQLRAAAARAWPAGRRVRGLAGRRAPGRARCTRRRERMGLRGGGPHSRGLRGLGSGSATSPDERCVSAEPLGESAVSRRAPQREHAGPGAAPHGRAPARRALRRAAAAAARGRGVVAAAGRAEQQRRDGGHRQLAPAALCAPAPACARCGVADAARTHRAHSYKDEGLAARAGWVPPSHSVLVVHDTMRVASDRPGFHRCCSRQRGVSGSVPLPPGCFCTASACRSVRPLARKETM
jgi:hypothetical protein